MCILSKFGIETETIIVVSNNSLLYVNQLLDHEGESSISKAPTMLFSFNVPKNTTHVQPYIITKKDLSDLISLHHETTVHSKVQFDSPSDGDVQKFFHEGYEILVGRRQDMYKEAIKNADESEKNCLSALVDDNINHGTHAVYAKPQSAQNDWTGIQLTFFWRAVPTFFGNVNEIIIPTCHETMPPKKTGSMYFYNQLIMFDESVHEGRNFTDKGILSIDNKKFKGRYVSDESSRFRLTPDMPLDGYTGKLSRPLYCGDSVVANNAVFLRLDTRSACNTNIDVSTVFSSSLADDFFC